MSTGAASNTAIFSPRADEEEALAALAAALARVPTTVTPQLIGLDDGAIDLPPSLYEVLKLAVATLLDGGAVSISPLHRLLTTTEAGDLLGVSRQYLTRLLDGGQIPHTFTGRHRRIQLKDLLGFKEARDRARRTALDELTADAAESGAYD